MEENEIEKNVFSVGGDLSELSKDNIESLVAKRISGIDKLIEDFIKNFNRDNDEQITVIDGGNLILCYSYFETVREHIKPTVKNRINKYKMCSIIELLIIKHQIFECSDPRMNRRVNAEFALISGLSAINSMIQHDRGSDDGFYIDSKNMNVGVESEIKRLLRNHSRWLRIKSLDELPVFVNAHLHEAIGIMSCATYEMH